mmetsp:Transcript_102360/g.203222  ORF Transcript_102360/g.203222 Transcript_102360/m.203222 type:complete len:212 (-) Transcript_102360:1110-1745(-)
MHAAWLQRQEHLGTHFYWKRVLVKVQVLILSVNGKEALFDYVSGVSNQLEVDEGHVFSGPEVYLGGEGTSDRQVVISGDLGVPFISLFLDCERGQRAVGIAWPQEAVRMPVQRHIEGVWALHREDDYLGVCDRHLQATACVVLVEVQDLKLLEGCEELLEGQLEPASLGNALSGEGAFVTICSPGVEHLHNPRGASMEGLEHRVRVPRHNA